MNFFINKVTGLYQKRCCFFPLLIFLFFVSRLVFIHTGPVFFDSPEYISRLQAHDFSTALLAGHWPYHFGYIFLFWPVVQIGGIASQIFFQILFSFLSIFFFYYFVKTISDQKTALTSSVIVSLLPLYWISNGTMMIETSYIAFFITSLYLFTDALKSKKPKNGKLVLSAFLFACAFFINTIVLLWIPIFITIAFWYTKKRSLLFFSSLFFFVFLAVFIEGFIMSHFGKEPILPILARSYLSKQREVTYVSLDPRSILVALRNFFIPLLRNNTSLVVILSFLSLCKMFFSNKKFLLLGTLWVAPAFLANQWWDSLFYGREALISSFGLAFLCALLLNRSWKTSLIIVYLLVVSVPVLFLLRGPIPYIQEAKLVKTLPRNTLLIESHFARPQVQFIFRGKMVFVNEPGWDPKLAETIEDYLNQGLPVFVSAQALSEPYGLYSGPYIHTLTLSYRGGFELRKIMTHFTLKEYKVINKNDNLLLYQIVSNQPSLYPHISTLTHSQRRIDYFDPITQLWSFLQKPLRGL